MALADDLHTAYGKLGEARDALRAAAGTTTPAGTTPLGPEDEYELRLMSDEAVDIADRLLKMQHLNVPLPTG